MYIMWELSKYQIMDKNSLATLTFIG